MKINKILAAGIAATLAVTSLSAVASAEVKSIEFPMDYTWANVSWNNTKIQWFKDNDYIAARKTGADETAKYILNQLATAGLAAPTITEDGTKGIISLNGDGGITELPAVFTPMTAAMTAAATKSKAQYTPIVAAIAGLAASSTAGSGINASKADDALKDANYLASLYENYINALNAAIDAVEAVEDKTAAADTDTKLTTATVAAIVADINTELGLAQADYAKVTLAIDQATEALGTYLVEDYERGGIWIDTTKTFDVTVGGVAMKAKATGAKISIKGTKLGSTANESYANDFADAYTAFGTNHLGLNDASKSGKYIVFGPRYVNRPGYVNLNVFGTITDVELDISFDLYNADGTKATFFTEDDYNKYKKVLAATLRNALIAADGIRYLDQFGVELDVSDVYSPLAPKANYEKDPYWGDNQWVVASKYETGFANHETNLYKMYRALYNSVLTDEVEDNSGSKKTDYAFLRRTTATEGSTVFRNNVLNLASTRAYQSLNEVGGVDGAGQTYNDDGRGTLPNRFAGLATQCADFFHKQNNGQVIFHFTDAAKTNTWVSNGVPSTEVGLRTALAGTAFALFFNYANTTGSIQTIGTVDKDALTVTFDMAQVLDDFGYHTKGALENIYYGLNTGLDYGNGNIGYFVDKVTLQYDDAPAAVDATTDDDDADDDAAVVVADDDDDDDDIAADDDIIEDDDDDDDDAGEIIADDDDDDDDVNNEVDYVDGDDDANPGTGVGLAVIPAIVAAAAVAVSKKRK